MIHDRRSVMPRATKRKERLLSVQLPESDVAIIDCAASLRGRSRTEFVRDAAVRAAEDVLMEAAPDRVSSAAFKAFLASLSGPARSGLRNGRTLPPPGTVGGERHEDQVLRLG